MMMNQCAVNADCYDWQTNEMYYPVMRPPPGFDQEMTHQQSPGFSQILQNGKEQMKSNVATMVDEKLKPVIGHRLLSIPEIFEDETPEEIAEFFMAFDSITAELDDKQRVFWLDMKLRFGSQARLVFEDANEFFAGSYEKIRMAIWEQLGVFEKYDIVYDKAWFKQRVGIAEPTTGLQAEPNCVSIGFMCMPKKDDESKAEDEQEIPFQVEPEIEDWVDCPDGNAAAEPEERMEEFDEIAFGIIFPADPSDALAEKQSGCSSIIPVTEVPFDKTSAMIEQRPPMDCNLLKNCSSRGYALPGADKAKWMKRRKKGQQNRLGTIGKFGGGQVIGKQFGNQDWKRKEPVQDFDAGMLSWIKCRWSNWEKAGNEKQRERAVSQYPRRCDTVPRHLVKFRSPNIGKIGHKLEVNQLECPGKFGSRSVESSCSSLRARFFDVRHPKPFGKQA
jgi:hypothetical protein